MKSIYWASGLGLLVIASVSAQETPPFAFNFDAGAGYNFSSYVGLMAQFNFNRFDVNSATVNALGFPGGDVRLWSATLDPIIHTNPRGPVDVYFIGGGGWYQRTQEFTQPTT